MLRAALKPLQVPVLGVMRRGDQIQTPGRYLGLVPVAERRAEAERLLHALGTVISDSINLDEVLKLARSSATLNAEAWSPESEEADTAAGVRVAVAAGPSFSFLYRENLELMEAAGAEVVTFDPTSDEALPAGTDALYLGGGFPEAYAEALSANVGMRESVRAFAGGGRPVVAECGGLLYLVRELDGHAMCGVLDATARMTGRLTLGYREALALTDSPLAEAGAEVRGHEFHYSTVEPRAGEKPAWDLAGRGAEGFVAGGVHASYLHTHWAAKPGLPRRLVRAARGAVEAGV
jgi:cobyrinic acid a,c-diamide synthase